MKPNQAHIEALILHSDPSKRVIGRLMATEMSENFSRWFEDESQVRQTPPADVLLALIKIFTLFSAFTIKLSAEEYNIQSAAENFGNLFTANLKEYLKISMEKKHERMDS